MAKIRISFEVESKDLSIGTLVKVLNMINSFDNFSKWFSSWWYTNAISMGNWREYGARSDIKNPEFKTTNFEIKEF